MFITTNPFAQLNAESPEIFTPGLMQGYVILMILFVIGGTLFDVWHKKSAKYFFENAERAKKKATRQLDKAERRELLVKTIKNEVLTSSEFSNQKRRLSHLMSMYGFIVFVATTAIMIFGYADAGNDTPAIWPLLWHLGALSLAAGGYWFWFAIRVDVAAEGKPWNKIAPRADMFILSLLAMSTFALLWSITNGLGIFFVLFILATTILFAGVIWSKFAHMFFKPAAAYQKKQVWADGSREGLPDMPDLSDPAVHEKFPDIPTYMGKNPPNMGAGIRREPARHY
ncbi:hypothetical protein OO007_10995 [Cocleimonas sp. KMM 6892]|uniref:hypothetical protein n=1 Tax=unclassified Cocleimonas TaxID=2639732 RepID=UPI002DB79E75|nr:MULTISPECIES: hypothetical protein [unclassified Cocleimonas]MEB8432755.1 hypothetical protein [Cocleimonas sp. KMM 6892]MEC4715614.1 hypothetical protein [Cocleimonas sp. KMM 6895]MEC4744768.1 hypothetical protein [Cocleimonas sp. KMM 6896]